MVETEIEMPARRASVPIATPFIQRGEALPELVQG
jgi:hypothetical protein